MKITHSEQQSPPPRKSSLRDFGDNIKHTNICTPKRKDRAKGIESLFEEIITENFPNWVKKIGIQVQETQSPQNDKPKETHTKMRYK